MLRLILAMDSKSADAESVVVSEFNILKVSKIRSNLNYCYIFYFEIKSRILFDVSQILWI